MTVSEILKHPLFIVVVGMLVTAIVTLLGFAFRRVVLAAISELKTSVKGLSDSMEGHTKQLAKFEVEVDELKKDQETSDRSSARLAVAVHKMLISLPTNYCTKDDLNRSTDMLSKKLDAIDNRLKDAPSREEIDRRLLELKH